MRLCVLLGYAVAVFYIRTAKVVGRFPYGVVVGRNDTNFIVIRI